MPTYYYHLIFELYSNPYPPNSDAALVLHSNKVWLPQANADVFDDFPTSSLPRVTTPRAPIAYSDRYTKRAEEREAAASAAEQEESPHPSSHFNCPYVFVEEDTGNSGGEQEDGDDEAVLVPHPLIEPYQAPAPRLSPRKPHTAHADWRFGSLRMEAISLTMTTTQVEEAGIAGPSSAVPQLGPIFDGGGTATKAECYSLETKASELGWGVVHFYRELHETPSLERTTPTKMRRQSKDTSDGTTLCIPAVPGYMSPSNLLGFIGEEWIGAISHCRMVISSAMRTNLVLLKFRDSNKAKQWKGAFEGKMFRPGEICYIVFVGSVTFDVPTQPDQGDVASGVKPHPPPAPPLIELPTCPVCLERMDDTNGLMTITCSHVFHCTCLRSWKGMGCPVCRFSNTYSPDDYRALEGPDAEPFGSQISNLCSICDSPNDLYICLICGYVGCGRYKGGHAKEHWNETAHCFALEVLTQYVWDYAGDAWVHRLIREKGDGKLVELPGRSRQGEEGHDAEDVVPRSKLDNMSLEFSHLLSSQLETQRTYYEDLINKAIDKRDQATRLAETLTAESSERLRRFEELEEKYTYASEQTLPALECELAREKRQNSKMKDIARRLTNSLQDEKKISEGLMDRVVHLNAATSAANADLEALRAEITQLRETNHDLSMFISGQQRLSLMQVEGALLPEELAEGFASVPEESGRSQRWVPRERGSRRRR